jgi:hypothetical protein
MARGPILFVAAGIAGLLVWVASRIGDHSTWRYWVAYGIIGVGGFLLGVAQVAGLRPLGSPSVFLFAFVPALIVVGWIAVAGQPVGNTLRSHVLTWSSDLGIRGPIRDLLENLGVLAFGLGALLGFSLVPGPPREAVPAAPVRDWRTGTTRPMGPIGAGAVSEREPARTIE